MTGRSPAAGTGVEDDVNRLVIAMARRHRYLAGRLLEPLGLHPGQEVALRLLWERDGRTLTDLATGLGIELPSLTATVGALVRAGLVSRDRSPTDGRAVVVRLTPAGRRLRPRVEQALDELGRATTAGLSDRQAAQLRRLLALVAANLADAAGGRTGCP